MDKQTHTGMILVDLQEAFDTLKNGILHEKNEIFRFPAISNYGLSTISQKENFWFVLITFFSEAGTLKCGVPQDSMYRSCFYCM